MGGNYLLDTNAVIGLFRDDEGVASRIHDATSVTVSAITAGELFFGACRSDRPSQNFARIEEFLGSLAVLECTQETARVYGALKAALRAKGRPIPENDLWIASIARQHNLSVLTRDDHFLEIPDLPVETW